MVSESIANLEDTINLLNKFRAYYNNYDVENHFYIDNDSHIVDKKVIWKQMIQLIPSSYNQRRTVMLNYEVLAGIHTWRKDHKLDEWREFCQWIESLPYSEIITARAEEKEVLDTPTMDKIQMLLRDAGYLQASIAVEDMKNNFESVMKNKESEG